MQRTARRNFLGLIALLGILLMGPLQGLSVPQFMPAADADEPCGSHTHLADNSEQKPTTQPSGKPPCCGTVAVAQSPAGSHGHEHSCPAEPDGTPCKGCRLACCAAVISVLFDSACGAASPHCIAMQACPQMFSEGAGLHFSIFQPPRL